MQDSHHLFLYCSVTDPRHRHESSHRRRHRRQCRRRCHRHCHRHCHRQHILENFQLRSTTVEDLLPCSRLRLHYPALHPSGRDGLSHEVVPSTALE